MELSEIKGVLLSHLPTTIQDPVVEKSSFLSDVNSIDPFVVSYLKDTLPHSDIQHENLDSYMRKRFILEKQKKKQREKPRKKKNALSVKERQQLGLYKLKRKGLRYEDFIPLHNLWEEYISSYLDIETLEENGFTGSPMDRHWENTTRLLLKADYHGSILTVDQSRCSNLIGKSGIVVMDTKNTFKLIGQDNILRTIPKMASIFTLEYQHYTFTIIGKLFCMRPTERSTKKIKTCITFVL